MDRLQKEAPHTSEQERIEEANTLIETYVSQTGERPPNDALDRLTDVVLYDHLEGDKRPNKVQADEYPILTDIQLKVRRTGREVPLTQAYGVATDGRDYRPPYRRPR